MAATIFTPMGTDIDKAPTGTDSRQQQYLHQVFLTPGSTAAN